MPKKNTTIMDLLARADQALGNDLDTYVELVGEAITLAVSQGDDIGLARCYISRASYHRKQMELDQAQNDIERARALVAPLDPSDAKDVRVWASNAYALILFAGGNYEEAVVCFREVLAVSDQQTLSSGDRTNVHHNLGAALMQCGRHKESIEQFRLAIRTSPQKSGVTYVLMLVNLATSCVNSGDYTSAHAYLDQALACGIEKAWLTALAYCRLADVLLNEDKPEDALVWTEKAVTIARDYGDVEYVREALATHCDILMALGRNREAIEELEEVLGLNLIPSDRATALSAIALAHARLKVSSADADESLLHANTAQRYIDELECIEEPIDPLLLPGLFRQVAEVHSILGDGARAYTVLRQSIDQKKKNYPPDVREELTSLRHVLEIEREAHEKNLQRLRADNMQQQLTSQAVAMAAQAAMIDRFRRHITSAFQEMSEPVETLRRIRDTMRELPKQELDWTGLEAEFASAHPDFRARLIERYPALTPQQLRICLLVHLNLKSNEIAQLTGVTDRNIEKHRLNIRKTMGLAVGDDLAKVLRDIWT